jgi:hypothetical protein
MSLLGPVIEELAVGASGLRAWKRARVELSEDCTAAWFRGVTLGAREAYRGEDDATCAAADGHRAPHVDCSCGFHALPRPSRLFTSTRDVVLLEVELSGRVVHHADGFRAEHQRVLAVRFPRSCQCCVGTVRPATRFAAVTRAGRIRVPVPVCDACGGPGFGGVQELTPATLAGLLTCEVTWDEASGVAAAGRHERVVEREHDRRCAVAQPELREDVPDVALDGALGDV